MEHNLGIQALKAYLEPGPISTTSVTSPVLNYDEMSILACDDFDRFAQTYLLINTKFTYRQVLGFMQIAGPKLTTVFRSLTYTDLCALATYTIESADGYLALNRHYNSKNPIPTAYQVWGDKLYAALKQVQRVNRSRIYKGPEPPSRLFRGISCKWTNMLASADVDNGVMSWRSIMSLSADVYDALKFTGFPKAAETYDPAKEFGLNERTGALIVIDVPDDEERRYLPVSTRDISVYREEEWVLPPGTRVRLNSVYLANTPGASDAFLEFARLGGEKCSLDIVHLTLDRPPQSVIMNGRIGIA